MRQPALPLIIVILILSPLRAFAQDSTIPEALPESREDFLLRITQHVPVKTIAVALDGILAAGSDVLRVWDGINGHAVASLSGLYPNPFEAVAFSPDGTAVAGLSAEGELNAWTLGPLKFKASFVDRPRALKSGENRAHFGHHANAIAFSPDSKLLVSVAADVPAMKVWDVETGQLLREIGPQGVAEITAVGFSPDGTLLAYASQHDLVILKVPEWSNALTFPVHSQRINSIAFSPDGNLLATASDDHTAHLWKVENGESVAELKGHMDAVRGVAFSPDSEAIATASFDKTVRLWTKDGTQTAKLTHPRPVYAVGFTDAGTEVITGAADNTVRLWRVSDGKLTQRLSPGAQANSQAFLFERNSAAMTLPSDSERAVPLSELKDVPVKRLDDGTRRDLSVISSAIIKAIQTDQLQDFVALCSPDHFMIDEGAGVGPAFLNDREGLLVRLFDTIRLRSVVGPYLAEHEPTMENITVQRFRSLRDIFRNDEAVLSTQVLDRFRTSTDEATATIVIYWGSDPSNYGLREYPQFTVSRTKGAWSIVDVALPLDVLSSSRYAAIQLRARQLRSFTNSFVQNGTAEGALKSVLQERRDELAYEIEFPKGSEQWIPSPLTTAEIIFRWDGDPSDYGLSEYPRIRVRLESGAWRVVPLP